MYVYHKEQLFYFLGWLLYPSARSGMNRKQNPGFPACRSQPSVYNQFVCLYMGSGYSPEEINPGIQGLKIQREPGLAMHCPMLKLAAGHIHDMVFKTFDRQGFDGHADMSRIGK